MMSTQQPVWIIGGYQSDFARNFTKESLEIGDLVRETTTGTLAHGDTTVSPSRSTWPSTTSASPRRGCSGDAIDSGITARDGALPINPSGGLIGVGHPVGATGYQVAGARRFATLNIGGSTATVACTVVEAE